MWKRAVFLRCAPLASLLLFLGLSWAAEPTQGVLLEISKTAFDSSEVVEVTVSNTRSTAVFVSGCGALRPEIFEGERYRPSGGEACSRELVARKLPPGKTVLRFEPSPEVQGSIVRLGMVFGWGCQPERKLSRARCQDFATVHSGNFRVQRVVP